MEIASETRKFTSLGGFTFLITGNAYILATLRLFKLITVGFFFYSTVTCINTEKDFEDVYISKLHDALVLLTFVFLEPCFVRNKHTAEILIEIIEHDYNNNREENIDNLKIKKEFVKELDLYCKVVTTTYILGALLYCVVTSMIIPKYINMKDEECIHLVIGWVWNTEYDGILLFLNVICMSLLFSSSFQWFMIMYCMTIKIKCEIMLLCSDLENIGNFVPGLKVLELKTAEDQVGMANPKVKTQNCPCGKIHSEELNPGPSNIQKQNRDRIIAEQVKTFLKATVKRHIDITQFVKLTDKTFRFSILISTQLGALIVALAIPKIGFGSEMLRADLLHRGIEILEIMGSIGMFNYFGQMVINQSESLMQALYNCDWTDKPYSLRRGLLIMQIMASKPLRLTIGGMYTLGMETYANILKATYSYTSLIQSLDLENHELY